MSLVCPACSENHQDLDSLQLHVQSSHLVWELSTSLDRKTPSSVSSNPDILHLKKAYARIRNKYLNLLPTPDEKILTKGQEEEFPCIDCGAWFRPDTFAVVKCPQCHAKPGRLSDLLVFSHTTGTLDKDAIFSQFPSSLSSTPVTKDKRHLSTKSQQLFSKGIPNFSPISSSVRPESSNGFEQFFLNFNTRDYTCDGGIEYTSLKEASLPSKLNSTKLSFEPATSVKKLLRVEKSQNTSPANLSSPTRGVVDHIGSLAPVEAEKTVRLKDSESQTTFPDDLSINKSKMDPNPTNQACLVSSEDVQTDNGFIAQEETKQNHFLSQKPQTISTEQVQRPIPRDKTEPKPFKENQNCSASSEQYQSNNAPTTQAQRTNEPTTTAAGERNRHTPHRSHSLDSKTAFSLEEEHKHGDSKRTKPSKFTKAEISSSEDDDLPSIKELIPNFRTVKTSVSSQHRQKASTSFSAISSHRPEQSILTKVKQPDFKKLVSSFKKTLKLQDPTSLATLAKSPKFHQDLTFISQNMEQIRSKLSDSEQQFLSQVFCIIMPPSPTLPASSLEVSRKPDRNLRRVMELAFPWLSTAALLRCRLVCGAWRKILSQPHHWSTISLVGCLVHPQLLKLLATLCSATHTINLQGLRLKNDDCPTRGRLESKLDLLLQSCGSRLRTFSVIDCEDLITDKCLWQLSRHNPALEQLIFMSRWGGPSAESLWTLGSGCSKLHTLLVPPLDSTGPDQFDDHAANMVARCWPHLKELCVGGNKISLQGLLDVARGCPSLVTLELDHMGKLDITAAQALCQSRGLLQLRCLYLTRTLASPSALRCLAGSLDQLQAIFLVLSPQDYAESGGLGYFKKKIHQLQEVQRKDPLLSRILHLTVQE